MDRALTAKRFQILIPGSLVLYGTFALDFVLDPLAIPVTVFTALFFEWCIFRYRKSAEVRRPAYESAMISALSTLLLFRSTEIWAYAAVVALAISSKLVIRVRGRHFLNPSNAAVLVGSLIFPGWIASGQWGHDVVIIFAMAGGSALILSRAGRLDSAFAFIAGSLVCEALRHYVLGYSWAIVGHHFTDGAFWLFALYMITDPRTTPVGRRLRIAHGLLIAVLGTVLAQYYYVRDSFNWALLVLAPIVPLFDLLGKELPLMNLRNYLSARTATTLVCFGSALAAMSPPQTAHAFCGFYVGRADASLFNSASRVVMVHDDGKTVLTMVNDYRGEPRSFALVVPVPVVLEKDLVRVIDAKVVDHVDGFTAPRLVEYFDPDPCYVPRPTRRSADSARMGGMASEDETKLEKSVRAKALGVTIEASYTVGEYDIEVLGAKQSDGLETYLRENKYNIPKGAASALAPYIRSKMKFFVARVNLGEQAKTGFTSLRPLQFAFPDERFMLPIRLGMLNADGPQDLIIYSITKQYRVEVTNYRNPKLPSDVEVPTFIKDDFKRFYKDLFARSLGKENDRAVFTEHAWNMSWCDPCASEPLSNAELEKLGVWWADSRTGGAQQAFVTRIHARYTPETFPEDLMMKVTKDATNFQARYVLRHPWGGTQWCEGMPAYRKGLDERREREIVTLATLTGWDATDIRGRMKALPKLEGGPAQPGEDPAWKNKMKELFKKDG